MLVVEVVVLVVLLDPLELVVELAVVEMEVRAASPT